MVETIRSFVSANSDFLTGAVAFISGVCLLYLVMWRTIQKRAREAGEPGES